MLELSADYRIDWTTKEQCQSYLDKVESLNIDLGEIKGIGHFQTTDKVEKLRDYSYDENAKTALCFACSV